jgi:hypothetical protein
MPHDKNGVPLVVGDEVLIPAKVLSISEGTEYCNLSLETAEVMFPGNAKVGMSLNSKQVVKGAAVFVTEVGDFSHLEDQENVVVVFDRDCRRRVREDREIGRNGDVENLHRHRAPGIPDRRDEKEKQAGRLRYSVDGVPGEKGEKGVHGNDAPVTHKK